MPKSDKEIRKWLQDFADDVFENANRDNAATFNMRLDIFVKDNGVTAEQMQEFAESGAGEELYMLTC